MPTKKSSTKSSKLKPVLIVVGVLAGLYVLFVGLMTLSDYNRIRPYKALATELNQTLGGGYRISYTWKCELESTNCPSARMIKDADFKGNEEAKMQLNGYKELMLRNGYHDIGFGICEADKYFSVYCTLEAKKDGKTITINTKQDFVGIDIQL